MNLYSIGLANIRLVHFPFKMVWSKEMLYDHCFSNFLENKLRTGGQNKTKGIRI